MVLDESHGTETMRKKFYDGAVKGFAKATYKFKQAVSIVTTGAWINYFWREDPDVLENLTGNTTKGIPRLAEYPSGGPTFQRISTVIEKYGREETIAWEDLISDDIDVRDRTLLKVAERVTKSIDDEIWDVLTESRSVSDIQSVTITDGHFWHGSSGAIIDDLLQAKQLIAEKNYPTNNLMCFLSPRDHRSVMTWLSDKGSQFPTIGADVANNGSVGKLAGINLIVSTSVSASYALVVVPKRCGTWKQLVPLTTAIIEEPLKRITIRSAELGVTQLTDPKACVLIIGTQTQYA